VGTTDLSLFAGEFLKGEALAFGSPSTLPISTQDNRVIAGIVDDPEQSAQLVLSEVNDAVRAPCSVRWFRLSVDLLSFDLVQKVVCLFLISKMIKS